MNTRLGGYVSLPVVKGIAVFTALLVMFLMLSGSFVTPWMPPQSEAELEPVVADSLLDLPGPDSFMQNERYAVYFDNDKLNTNNQCDAVFPVWREVGENIPEVDALLSLFAGPTETEKQQGFNSFFSEKTASAIKGLTFRDGIAAINMADIRSLIPNANSSCGTEFLISPVENTLMQFGNVKKVLFAIDGNPETFYEWVQIGCSEENNNCDASMFK